jgi:hypothetical protein
MAKGKVNTANGCRQSSSGQPAAVGRLHEPNAAEGEFLAGYAAMARDRAQEAEALEWCEGLISDAIPRQG